MWLNDYFGKSKPILGLVHLNALPGSVPYDHQAGLNDIIEKARYDYLQLIDGGIDGILFCNENDKPYSTNVGIETVASMTRIVLEVTNERKGIPIGIDIQWDVKASIAVAQATNAKFVRGIVSGAFCGDLGFLIPDAHGILEYRDRIGARSIKLLTNMMPEFSFSLDQRPLALRAKTLIKSTLIDAICVSGVMAGQVAPYHQLQEIKNAVDSFPVIANTGVNYETIEKVIQIADACIVATCLKENGNPKGRIDANRVKKLVELANYGRNF